MRILAGRVAARTLAVLIAVTGLSGIASAQQIQGGATSELLGFFVRGVDSAYDPNSRTYMVVGGAGTLLGICINEQGVPVSGPILINNDNYGAFPRVRYGAGGFLVVWPEEVGNPSQLHSRIVHCSGATGPEQLISADATAWLESGAAIAYSPTSQRFLVTWKSFPLAHSPARVKATLVNLNGTQFGPVVDLSAGFGRDPGAAWNPYNDSFGVSFSGETGPNGSTGFSGFAVVPAGNPAAFGRVSFNTIPGGLVTISDIDFNPYTGRFVMTWFELSSGLYARIAELDASGNIVSSGIASGLLGSYDALSIALNPVTGTFGLVGLDRRNDNVLGLELNTRGFPFHGENTLSAVPRAPQFRPGRYTRVSSSSSTPTFNSTFSIGFGSIGSLIASSAHAGTGGLPGSFDAPPPAPAPPPGPTPSACPGAAPVSNWVCVNGGWLPPDHPLASGGATPAPPPPPPAPAPTGCTGAAPVSNWICVNGGWLPPDHPLAAGHTAAPPPPPPPAPAPTPAPTGCVGGAPVSNWVCVNGGWLPPDHPLAVGYTPAPAPPAPAPSSCTTPQPGSNWYCVNGGWVPPNSPLAPGGACVGSAPAPGWVCTASGGWVPPNHPLAGGGGD